MRDRDCRGIGIIDCGMILGILNDRWPIHGSHPRERQRRQSERNDGLQMPLGLI
jgi:hypothetical protein